ncbi:MAG: helix-hairpin-helix domain-containing protein [Bacteroidota bacterium]|nr:helix-hairpin-helix domain-containing protein [Flavisolibacter sp.]MBD0349831.1 helix-hairpin-helix domain-containing protein [Flavisolibacter sp.]MBD0367157.1 helix-hairpin-helix domain-containing protein [Flavisolibacter sp.]MBD0375826.1 helix-hairpin-helix domain-containing protein [Flavisolibacter sp.]MDQ3846497.1 helix-hairpin-helix domain-containing protein [Bacteroidota bacterium]
MKRKQLVKDYLFFSRKERISLLSLLAAILLMYLLPQLFSKSSPSAVAFTPDSLLSKAADTLQARSTVSNQRLYENKQENNFSYSIEPSHAAYINGELFRFDPNTLPTEGWKRLGLNDHTIRTINNYRSKGGHFYKPDDLKKIWGMPQDFYERVVNYVVIPSEPNSNYTFKNQAAQQTNTNTDTKSGKRIAVVDVNTADTSSFIALPGIGSKLATRITNFRDKLGGFYSVEQISETYGLPDSTFQKLKPYFHVNPSSIQKMDINTATKDELKVHPYIRWNLANAIVEYRNQHGNYKSLDELKNIALIDEAIFVKITPYLSL